MSDEPSDLTEAITRSIDRWHIANPNLMVSEILASLEKIRYALTEELVSEGKFRRWPRRER